MPEFSERPDAGRAVPGQGEPGETRALHEIYPSYFRVKEASDPDSVRECLRIRYSVYCVENSYETNDAGTGDLESDEYDAVSKHAVLYYSPTELPIGTVRMIYPRHDAPEQSFVLQNLVDWGGHRETDYFPVMTTGEISRFCVTRQFRRRLLDPVANPSGGIGDRDELRLVIPNMTLGLIEWLVRISVRDRLSHWCGVMEPRLLRLLTRLGIHFEPIGDLVEFHGRRQPCVTELGAMLGRMRKERADIWRVVTAQGAHVAEMGV